MSNPTNVFGTIVDANSIPYFPASVTASLTPVTTNPTVNGLPVNPNPGVDYTVSAVTAPDGSFSMPLFANGVITPGGTQWLFKVACSGTAQPAGHGPENFAVAVTISGSSQDVGLTLSAAAPALLPSGGGGSGTVTNTGTLTAGQLLIANGGVDITADPIWSDDGGGGLRAQSDDASIGVVSTDGLTSTATVTPSRITVSSGSTEIELYADTKIMAITGSGGVVSGETVTPVVFLDMNNGGDGPADLKDSTGAVGTSGQVLSSLGTGLGVKWVTL